MAKTENEKIVTVKVARRKSVEFQGELYLPGSTFDVDLAEALDLHKKGFVVDPGSDPDEDNAEAGGDAQ